MTNSRNYRAIITGAIGIAALAFATAASAQVPPIPNSVAAAASSSILRARVEARADARHATSTRVAGAQRVTVIQDRSNNEIDARIAALNKLLVRVQGMTKISASEQSSLESSLQSEVATLTALKASIDSDTSTSTLKADFQSITKSYRIYALVLPQSAIAATADRVLYIAGELEAVAAKIQAANTANLPAVTSALADLAAKTADAASQANAAVAETASLTPDEGATSTLQANTAALRDAQSKLKVASADLAAARKDAGTAAAAIKGAKVKGSVSASSTVQ